MRNIREGERKKERRIMRKGKEEEEREKGRRGEGRERREEGEEDRVLRHSCVNMASPWKKGKRDIRR